MAIYLRVSTKTKEARRKLEEIGNRSGKCLLKTFLDFELKNKLSNKFEPRAIIDYVTTTNDNIIYTFAEFLKNNEGDREKFKEAVKFQATSAGTNKKGLFYNLIYQNGSLNMGTLNKSKIKAFLLAKSDKDSIIDDQDVTDKEDKKSHRMKNTDIVKKLKSGRLSNILKVFMALVLWKYLKLKETEQNQPNPKPEPQPEPEPVNTRKTESVSDKKTEQTEDSSDEETEDVSAKEIEQLETKVKEIPLQNFQVKSSGVDDCQKSHTTPIPYGQGDAKLKTPYHTSLMREHLNEALVWNNQGVTFNDEFFECQDIPEWRTQQHRDVYRGSIYGMFGKSEFLGGLQFKKEEGTIKRFEEYVFEASVKNGENLPRIDLIKNLDINLYYLFYNELSWIYEHQDFLKKEDKDDPGVLYEYRLKRHVDDLNDECSTELRSLIEAWALEVDKLEDIEKGKTAQKFDASTTSKKILTQLRFGCLEELAQKVASNAAPDDTTKIRPEIQEVVRYQCAQALNVPSHAMNKDHVEYLAKKYDLVYKTNLLSSIMTVEAIASYATNYAKAFGDGSHMITENFDSKIAYSELCKILDRSARGRLQEDKRSFDERFRSTIESSKGELEKAELKLVYDWMSGKPKKISQIYDIMIIFTSEINTVPECFFTEDERFGYITFIKYLTDKNIISLD